MKYFPFLFSLLALAILSTPFCDINRIYKNLATRVSHHMALRNIDCRSFEIIFRLLSRIPSTYSAYFLILTIKIGITQCCRSTGFELSLSGLRVPLSRFKVMGSGNFYRMGPK